MKKVCKYCNIIEALRDLECTNEKGHAFVRRGPLVNDNSPAPKSKPDSNY